MAKTKQKEEKFGTNEPTTSKSNVFFEKNSKILTIILSVIVVLLLAFFIVQRYYLIPRESKAQEEVFMAQRAFGEDNFDIALNGDGNYLGFLGILDSYKGTKTAKMAYYYIGISYLRLGEYENAIEYLSKFNVKGHYIYALSRAAIGDAYLELDNVKEAISYYKKAADYESNTLLTPEFLKKLAYAYEMDGNNAKALATYKQIIKDYPKANIKNEVNRSIGKLEAIEE
ncbi:MAG: tetratricopeptide repeat protein [Bacteroidales bacterium]|nr:tetratricopeptide repeat protein [Bacteroidales bacterium]